jgi:hypothetical protein
MVVRLKIFLALALSVGLVLAAVPALAQHTATESGPGERGPRHPGDSKGEVGQPAQVRQSPQEKVKGVYYDFPDVLIPSLLELDREKSFVYDTASFTAGVLQFKGRVEVRSLAAYFVEAMTNDNWVLAARFTSPEQLLLFEKPNKRCMIFINETTMTTHVQTWVAPFLGKAR